MIGALDAIGSCQTSLTFFGNATRDRTSVHAALRFEEKEFQTTVRTDSLLEAEEIRIAVLFVVPGAYGRGAKFQRLPRQAIGNCSPIYLPANSGRERLDLGEFSKHGKVKEDRQFESPSLPQGVSANRRSRS
jgi:hypothetical protein